MYDRLVARYRRVLAPLVVAAISACSSNHPAITQAVIAQAAQPGTHAPVGITQTYPPEQSAFHAIVTVANPANDTRLNAVWTAVSVENGVAPNTRLEETAVTLGDAKDPETTDSRNVDFTLRPADGRLPGSYQVDIYLNGRLDRTLAFSVGRASAQVTSSVPPAAAALAAVSPTPSLAVARAASPTPSLAGAPAARPRTPAVVPSTPTRPAVVAALPTATRTRAAPSATRTTAPVGAPAVPSLVPIPSGRIRQVTLAKGVKGAALDPDNPTTVFTPTSIVHAVIALQNAPDDTEIHVAWYISNAGSAAAPNTVLATDDLVQGGTRNLDLQLTPRGRFPVGTYRVEIYVEDVLDQVATFTVQ